MIIRPFNRGIYIDNLCTYRLYDMSESMYVRLMNWPRHSNNMVYAFYAVALFKGEFTHLFKAILT